MDEKRKKILSYDLSLHETHMWVTPLALKEKERYNGIFAIAEVRLNSQGDVTSFNLVLIFTNEPSASF